MGITIISGEEELFERLDVLSAQLTVSGRLPMPGSSSISSLRELELLAERELSNEDIEREAAALVEKLAEEERKRGGVDAAVGALEEFRKTLAEAIGRNRPEGRLQRAYSYAATSIKPVTLKITQQ
jgi:hypothetical protein